MSDKIGIFSFFSGAGFLDLGFERTGLFETLFMNEYHKPFADIYIGSRKKLGVKEPRFGYQVADITENLTNLNSIWLEENLLEAKRDYPLVGFIGGPPCPDFSVGGKNKGKHGENGKLSGTYIELISRLKPDFFLFENVKGLYRTAKHREFFESLKIKLINSGYYLTEKLINAIEFGAPQDRDRIILVGFQRNVLGDLGFKLNGSPLIQNFNWEKNARYNSKELAGLNWPKAEPFKENSSKLPPDNIPLELTVEHWFDRNDVLNHANAIHFFTPRAGLSKFLIIDEGDDLKKSYKRLHRWRYSPTAAYGNNEVHLHPYKARRISASEALAIQSLPKEFEIPQKISLTDMFKSIGNGVPYLAAKGLAENIFDFIYNNPIKDLKLSYGKTDSR
ncbi:MAG: DNA cytosine methyltransferase [Saprospiraceae bacterium]|jgi:DNA (cytosine-5)-methyltransferase 1|nr:DNA cytosine methyltransferase [Saprospiraceae bacterium]